MGDHYSKANYKSGSNRYINRYGNKSTARYRIKKIIPLAEYKDRPPIQRVTNRSRYGNVKENGKYKYTKHNILAIVRVAWKTTRIQPSRENLKLIDPNLVTDLKAIPTYILIL